MIQELEARIERGWKLGLDGMRSCLARMEPVRYPVILVGGTNGKGSVCAALHRYFLDAGLRTGLTTSPHLCDVCERIVVNGEPVDGRTFAGLFEYVRILDEDRSTYFETLALMAIEHFRRERVDVAVVEIGMGGRLDAFNALDPVVSVVTSIGLEHTRWLGDTIEKIAVEKAAIARQGRAAVLGTDLPALHDAVVRIGARPRLVAPVEGSTWDRNNAALAEAAAEEFSRVAGRSFDRELFHDSARRAWWPGRFDHRPGRPGMLLDAAHNPHAARALAARLRPIAERRRITALAAFLSDKDVPGILNELSPVVSEWIFTEVAEPRALPAERIPGHESSMRSRSVEDALSAAKSAAGPDGILLVTGSIFLLGEVLHAVHGPACGPFPPHGNLLATPDPAPL